MSEKIKKLLMGLAAIGALAFGGAQLAGAAGNDGSDTGAAQSERAEQDDAGEAVTGAAAKQAGAAALAEVGSGEVTKVHAENPADDAGEADAPEPGDTADPAYEAKTAYEVEVTKADGSQVDVHLDRSFHVLGNQVDHADGPEDGEDD